MKRRLIPVREGVKHGPFFGVQHRYRIPQGRDALLLPAPLLLRNTHPGQKGAAAMPGYFYHSLKNRCYV